MSGRCFRLGLVSLLGVGCSVGSIDEGLTFGDPDAVPSGEDESSGTGTVLTTGVTDNPSDPTADEGTGTDATTGTGGPDSDTAPDTDPAGSTEGSSGGPQGSTGAMAQCGDGMVSADEACDGDDLADMTCADIGTFVGGVLSCDAACAYDTSGCTELSKEPIEVCETINLAIPDSGSAVTSAVSLPEGGTVADAMIGVALNHTYIGDLTIDVEHGGTTVRVYDRECGTEENMDLTFDDAGAALDCVASNSGAATLPSEVLSSFDGASAGGVWTFSFQDNALLDEGSATEICVTVSF